APGVEAALQRACEIDLTRDRMPLRIDVLGPGRSMRQVPGVGEIRVGELKIDVCRLRRHQPCAAQLLNLVDAITRRIEPFPIGGTDSTNQSVGCAAEAIAVAPGESGVTLFIEAALLLPDMA